MWFGSREVLDWLGRGCRLYPASLQTKQAPQMSPGGGGGGGGGGGPGRHHPKCLPVPKLCTPRPPPKIWQLAMSWTVFMKCQQNSILSFPSKFKILTFLLYWNLENSLDLFLKDSARWVNNSCMTWRTTIFSCLRWPDMKKVTLNVHWYLTILVWKWPECLLIQNIKCCVRHFGRMKMLLQTPCYFLWPHTPVNSCKPDPPVNPCYFLWPQPPVNL